jgi:hypothetical protein
LTMAPSRISPQGWEPQACDSSEQDCLRGACHRAWGGKGLNLCLMLLRYCRVWVRGRERCIVSGIFPNPQVKLGLKNFSSPSFAFCFPAVRLFFSKTSRRGQWRGIHPLILSPFPKFQEGAALRNHVTIRPLLSSSVARVRAAGSRPLTPHNLQQHPGEN